MKTRTLLLLSVGCGLVILCAGGIKLLQMVTDRTEVPVLALGESARIGDMIVAVLSISESGDGTRVLIQMSGVEGEPVVSDWRVLADGRVLEPSGAQNGDAIGPAGEDPPICGRSSVVPARNSAIECVIRFPLVDSLQAIAYTRAGEQRQWAP